MQKMHIIWLNIVQHSKTKHELWLSQYVTTPRMAKKKVSKTKVMEFCTMSTVHSTGMNSKLIKQNIITNKKLKNKDKSIPTFLIDERDEEFD